jgi:hypothetical protein
MKKLISFILLILIVSSCEGLLKKPSASKNDIFFLNYDAGSPNATIEGVIKALNEVIIYRTTVAKENYRNFEV